MNKYDREHAHNIAAYQKRVQDILDRYEKDITRLASAITVDGDKPFVFSDHPAVKARYERLIRELSAEMRVTIENGEKVEWGRADAKNDALAVGYTGSAANAALAGYLARNNEALEAFATRKVNGLDLSGRVWNITDQFSTEIQDAIGIGLNDHLTADELSREVRRLLKHPDMLFRRVRDEYGVLHLSKRAKAYHPGQGVYRSSYMNAKRLTATEINMAYRTSDNMRREKLDFVVGIEIHLSNNHNCKGVPPGKFYDICDELQGKYPKDFKFTGWHPFCRCYTTTILKTREEMREDTRRRLKGEQPSKDSVNSVKELPDNFKKWLEDNGERIQRAKSLPYFLKDNGRMVDGVWEPYKKVEAPHEPTLLEIAAKRHAERTPEQAQAIRQRWAQRQAEHDLIRKTAGDILREAMDYGEVDFADLQAAVKSGSLNRMESLANKVEKAVSAVKKQEEAISELIPNAHTLHKTYSMSELQTAYGELDGVMKRWLSKYGYASLDSAPLQHLKNKLDFELSSPSVSYSQMEIVKKAVTDKMRLIDIKIEWENMVQKAATLKTFKTRSSVYKGYLAKIDEAIRKDDIAALKNSIADAENQQRKLLDSKIRKGSSISSALNKEYKGGATGKDISATIDARSMVSEDPYGGTYTNNVARLQGFDAPAKLVTEQEFAMLEKACGEVFYRTVNPTKFKGKNMSGAEFASQMYTADRLELNGKGGRAYGDGIYVATSSWDGRRTLPLTDARKQDAHYESACYGRGSHKTSEMTWTRMPRIIRQRDLLDMWRKLTSEQKRRFGGSDCENTYACALGYDGMYCEGPNYMVIWNRSIIAVKNN